MSGVTGDIKKLFNYKYKKRDDSLTDQYSRLFMTKVMLIAAALTGMQWYSDDIKCLVPSLAGKAIGGFSGKACWINGFYVYNELRDATGCNGYFGMPTNSFHNGTLKDTKCGTCVVKDANTDCVEMKKKFYIQYQWYPFFLATLALFYYLPYALFHIANEDILNLKKEIKKLDPDFETIIKTYFDSSDAASLKLQKRNIVFNLLIKVGYIIANVVVFLLCDQTLNGDYINFGTKWLKWSEELEGNNYIDTRNFLRAGDMLLPTFGFCDVLEEGLDIKFSMINEHKFVCEISQHILYQYVMMALWFLIIIGIFASVVGLVHMLVQYLMWEVMDKGQYKAKAVHKRITTRQGEYLMFIRKKNEVYYGKVLDMLYEKFRENMKKQSDPFDNQNSSF